FDRPGHNLETLTGLFVEIFPWIELRDFAGDARGEACWVKGLNGTDAALSLNQRLPEGVGILADRTQDTDAGEHSPTSSSSHESPVSPVRQSRNGILAQIRPASAYD